MLNRLLVSFIILFPLLSQAQVNHRAFLEQARFELSEERYVDALLSLNTAISVRPDVFESWFLRGVAKYNLNDFAGAEGDFSEALRQHPMHIRSYHYRGLTRLQLANYHDAMQDFRKALNFDPYDAGLRLSLGDALLNINRPQDALTEFGMALTIQPRNAEAWTKMAMAKRNLGRNDEAIADLSQALQYNYFSLEARLRLAMLKAEAGQRAEALIEFAILGRIHPDAPMVFFQQALVQLELGDTTAALQSLERVNQLEPANTLSIYNRALINSQLKNYSQAIELFGKVLERQPTHILSWFNMGVAQLKLKAYKESETSFSRAIALFPGFVAAWLSRAEARQEIGNQKGASKDRETAARLIDEHYQPEVPGSPFRNDTLWFNKIMRLESEFVGPGLTGLPQFAQQETVPFGPFMVVVMKRGNESGLKRDAFSSALDLNFEQDIVFGFMLAEQIEFASLLDSTATQYTQQPDLASFCDALDEVKHGNYFNAIHSFSTIDTQSVLYEAARLNLAIVYYLIEARKADEVTIASTTATPQIKTSGNAINLESAIDELKNLRNQNSLNAKLHHNMGFLFLRAGQYHPAIDAFGDALDIEPALGESWFNRALVLLFLSEYRLACYDLSKAGEQGIIQAYPLIRRYCLKR
jgi:tetratricopeptide (TPR) repeat protein